MKSVNLIFLVIAMLIVTCAGCDKCCPVGKKADKVADFPQPCSSADWVKKGIIIEPTEPWEGNAISNFAAAAEPLDGNRWRIWYGGGTPGNIFVAEGVPGEKMTKYQAVLSSGEPADAPLAIGNLPDGWHIGQPVHIKLKNGNHRLYFWAHQDAEMVHRFLVADSNDGRRYRVLDPYRPTLYHMADRANIVPSPIRKDPLPRPENEPPAPQELVVSDCTMVYQLPDGSFELYTATLQAVEKGSPQYATNDNINGLIRVIDRMVSDDGLRWMARQRVVEPDANDPTDLQFYFLSVTHTPKGRVGMLGHYRVKDQTSDIEWCFSDDGINWIRPFRNKPWLQRSWPGENPDSFRLYPSTSMVFRDDKWWFFYTGVNDSHNSKFCHDPNGQKQKAIMLAETESIWAK